MMTIKKNERKMAGISEDIEVRERFPKTLNLRFEKVLDIYMGENYHQKAALYRDPVSKEVGICNAKKLQGRKTSSNVIIDASVAIEIVKDFEQPFTVIIKHTNPCGAATADSLSTAFINALECDSSSLFGTTIGLNGKVDKNLAELILKETGSIRVETIIAPSFDGDALGVLSAKKELTIFELPVLRKTNNKEMDYKKVVGGLFVQDMDLKLVTENDLKVVTKKAPRKKERESLLFGDKVVKHAKSNAIVLCKGTKTIGIGTGQALREEAANIAFRKAKDRVKGATLASEARFSRRDIIDKAHKAGIKAIIEPGGDKIDQEIIAACDKYGISMVFTGCRHFKH